LLILSKDQITETKPTIMRLFLITLLFEVLPIIITAQTSGPGSINKKMAEASKLAKQAERLWKDEKYSEAEKLYYESLSVFPLHTQLCEFAERKMKLGDVNGANKIWTALAESIKSQPENVTGYGGLMGAMLMANQPLRFVYADMANNNFRSGDAATGIEAAVKCIELYSGGKPDDLFVTIIRDASRVALSIGDKISLQKLNDISSTLKKNMGNQAKLGVTITDLYLLILNEKYDEAIVRLEDLIEGKSEFMFAKVLAKETLSLVYILKREYDKAEENINEFISKNIFAKDKHYCNLKGMIAMGRGNNQLALKEFSTYLSLPVYQAPDKFKYYTKRAEAYEGLKEFEKAKNDYEAALIYNPDYEPALIGLARLEGRILTERKSDKAAPLIAIMEPVSANNILEFNGTELTIKGIAPDPGGLKSVTINGEKAYSQEGGDFWGNVQLKEGMNRISIMATDFSGNSAEKIIEVNKPSGSSSASTVQIKEGKNYALLIGCQNYDDSKIPSLEDPIPDAVKLKLILKNNYNFTDDNLFTLFNPVLSDFKKQFLEIYEVIQPEDKLVIFYAGHGVWVEKEKKGYWMLTDAKLDDPNTWLPNKTVLDMIARVPARHTLLITDACFSGSVFKTRGLDLGKKDETNPSMVQRMNEKISRVAITSGNDTEVPDKSVFMKYLVKALSENKEKYLTAQKMFVNQIIEAVMTETKTEPRYGTLELAGHLGGDFIFIKK
jgi:tetratricopeptide (TPR) repeat protein